MKLYCVSAHRFHQYTPPEQHKKIKESKLDERFVAKMNWANSELDRAKQEASIDFLKEQMFGGKMGEA